MRRLLKIDEELTTRSCYLNAKSLYDYSYFIVCKPETHFQTNGTTALIEDIDNALNKHVA